MASESSGLLWNLAVWDPDTATILTTYKGSSTVPHTLALVGQDYLVSAQPDKPLLNVWQVHRNEQMSQRQFTPGKCCALAVSPRGSYLVAAVEEKMSVWQTSTGRLWNVLSSHYQPVSCIKFSEDGSHFVSAGQDGQVLCWNLGVVVARRNLPGHQVSQVGKAEPKWSWRDHALPVTDLALTAGGGGQNAKAVSVSLDQTCKLFCLVSGQLLLSVSFPVALHAVAVDPHAVYTGGDNGTVYTIQLRSPPRTVAVSHEAVAAAPMTGHQGRVTALSLSLDGGRLASGGEDKCVRLWHLKSGQCVRVMELKGAVTSLRYLLPPPGMLDPAAAAPQRKLAVLQKGTEDREPLVTHLISTQHTRPLTRFEEFTPAAATTDESRVGSAEAEGRIQELKEINHQLYQFAVKNVLKGDLKRPKLATCDT